MFVALSHRRFRCLDQEDRCIFEHETHVRDIAGIWISDILWLKLSATRNMPFMSVTLLASQFPMSWLDR